MWRLMHRSLFQAERPEAQGDQSDEPADEREDDRRADFAGGGVHRFADAAYEAEVLPGLVDMFGLVGAQPDVMELLTDCFLDDGFEVRLADGDGVGHSASPFTPNPARTAS
ncbi:hypothetical protein CHELA40_14265 [Chelatococcus asaccharovorans]|nr:hypothetical protein CHELA17_61354 [Chelatococcus asaccharovorans]CAH1676325.1 hypothetical protein CHELA40_14265 [Chelatococcus asaccharovorans]